MKMTNEQMSGLVELMTPMEEKGKLGYAIARNLRIIKQECTEYLDMRMKLFQKYGEIKEDGRAIVKQDNIKPFMDELGDIPQLEHDVDVYKISLDDFLSGSLTSRQMESLLWMVKEDD